MKDKVATLVKLTNDVEDIKQELNSLVLSTTKEFIEYERKRYQQMDYPSSDNAYDDWYFSSDGFVYYEWEEHWNYGGHECGTISFPISFLTDTEAFNKFKLDCLRIEKARVDKEKQEELSRKTAEFERLRRELNIDI